MIFQNCRSTVKNAWTSEKPKGTAFKPVYEIWISYPMLRWPLANIPRLWLVRKSQLEVGGTWFFSIKAEEPGRNGHTQNNSHSKRKRQVLWYCWANVQRHRYSLTLDLDADPCQCEVQRVASLYEWLRVLACACAYLDLLSIFASLGLHAEFPMPSLSKCEIWNMTEYEARKRRTNRLEHLGTTSLQEKGCNMFECSKALHKDLQLRISCRGFSSQAPTELQQVH